MKIAIMQPYIFLYIGYFQLIDAVDKLVFYDDVNFIIKGWINRHNILVNGRKSMFTIPLNKVSRSKLINEVDVCDSFDWRTKMLKTFHCNYSKAPF